MLTRLSSLVLVLRKTSEVDFVQVKHWGLGGLYVLCCPSNLKSFVQLWRSSHMRSLSQLCSAVCMNITSTLDNNSSVRLSFSQKKYCQDDRSLYLLITYIMKRFSLCIHWFNVRGAVLLVLLVSVDFPQPTNKIHTFLFLLQICQERKIASVTLPPFTNPLFTFTNTYTDFNLKSASPKKSELHCFFLIENTYWTFQAVPSDILRTLISYKHLWSQLIENIS